MTANRWWVKLAARWLARIDGVSGQLRLAMLGLTGLSTAVVALKDYGHGEYAWPLIAVAASLALAYTWFYNEGGVRNQVQRDNRDLGENFAGPNMLMDDVIIGVAAFVAINGRKPSPEERKMIEESVREQWKKYRNGAPLDDTDA